MVLQSNNTAALGLQCIPFYFVVMSSFNPATMSFLVKCQIRFLVLIELYCELEGFFGFPSTSITPTPPTTTTVAAATITRVTNGIHFQDYCNRRCLRWKDKYNQYVIRSTLFSFALPIIMPTTLLYFIFRKICAFSKHWTI